MKMRQFGRIRGAKNMAHVETRSSGFSISIITVGATVALFLVLALLMAAGAKDPLMGIQAWTFIGLAGLFISAMVIWGGKLNKRNPFDPSVYENAIVKWGVLCRNVSGVSLACWSAW